MKPFQFPPLCGTLCILLVCCVIILPVSAINATPTATVPPVLQACSQAKVPLANFTCSYPADLSAPTPDGPPYTVKCWDNSTSEPNQPLASWKWDFGDGGSSTDQNPQHTYAKEGRYDVRLTAATFCGSQYSNTTYNTVSTYCSVPVPGFNTNVTEGFAPLAVGITDTSLRTKDDITRWAYWFDDTHSSVEKNPVYVYTKPGLYTINQTVWKDCVQLGSTFYPPAKHQIRVKDPNAGVETNVTTTTPAVQKTTPAPSIPSPAGTAPASLTPVAIASTPAPTPEVTPEPTKAGTPGMGAISLDSNPSGAQVYVDDVLRGTSPAVISDLTAGSHTVRFEKQGFQPMNISVTVPDRDTSSLATQLMPESGGIALLPLAALIFIIVGIIVGAVFLYLRQRAMDDD